MLICTEVCSVWIEDIRHTFVQNAKHIEIIINVALFSVISLVSV